MDNATCVSISFDRCGKRWRIQTPPLPPSPFFPRWRRRSAGDKEELGQLLNKAKGADPRSKEAEEFVPTALPSPPHWWLRRGRSRSVPPTLVIRGFEWRPQSSNALGSASVGVLYPRQNTNPTPTHETRRVLKCGRPQTVFLFRASP